MGLLWELFQEYQIGKGKGSHNNLEEWVAQNDADLTALWDLVGQMAQRIDDLEKQLYSESGGTV